jgi:hypothetical protein
MSHSRSPMIFRFCIAALHVASWMVREEERYEWLREWASELWHIASLTEGSSIREYFTLLAFVRGAFPDALLLAMHSRRTHRWNLPTFRSPAQCLIVLCLVGAAATTLALFQPDVRNTVLLPASYKNARGLVLISRDGYAQTTMPSIHLDEFHNWTLNTQHLYSDIAFYQMLNRRVRIGHGDAAQVSIARSSNNLFSVLGVPFCLGKNISFSKEKSQVLLSEAAWRSAFHHDRHIFGSTLFIAGEKATVIGVVAKDDWQLPGKADVWLLESNARMSELPVSTMGYAVARMQNAFLQHSADDHWHMLVPNTEGGYSGFECISLARRLHDPLYVFAFAAMLALLALPATTSLPLGDYPSHPRQQSCSIRVRRWAFLTAKLLLLLPILCFAPLDIVHAAPSLQESTASSAQLCMTFAASLFALRWVLRDQRRRCPVCLQLLQNPVRVGEPSRNFLAWNGTELICAGGHGFLHVPELPTSWCSTQRWLYLDPSWRTLFRPAVPASAPISS